MARKFSAKSGAQPKPTHTAKESGEVNELSSPVLAANDDFDNELVTITPKSPLRSQALGKRTIRNDGDSESSSQHKRKRVKDEPTVRKFSAPFKALPKSTRVGKKLNENNLFGARREPKRLAHSNSKSLEKPEDGTGARRSQLPGKAAVRSDLAGPGREAETEQCSTDHIETAKYGYPDPTKRPSEFQAYDGYHIDQGQNPHTWCMSGLNSRFLAEHDGAMLPGNFHPQGYCMEDGAPFLRATQNVQFNQGTDLRQPSGPGPYWQAVAQEVETPVQAHERYYYYYY